MADLQKSVFVDDEVSSQVINIVQGAKQYVICVTPYLELWRHARTALELAAKRGVKVTVIVRKEDWKSKTLDNISWLLANDIRVLAAEWLHAKIYLNEHALFVSSMNLTEVSTRNSLEIGLAVREPEAQRQIRDYIRDTVMPLAKPVSTLQTEPSQQPVHRPGQDHTQSQAVMATCIRCRRPVPPDPSKPLCDGCYDLWAEYGDENYPEQYCLVCAKPAEVTYAKPLCRECFRQIRRNEF
jgi:phosphatidylserine/phosphatidylglycerophosphate/cardiolipin synthase-like enzyme